MSDLRDLYQDIILDHSKKPRNHRVIDDSTGHADGYNPLCGDRVTIYVNVVDGVVTDASFEGSGCAISTASASIMTETLKGRTEADAAALFERFHALVTGKEAPDSEDLGKLEVFAGVREFPVRIKCATLAWHTLKAALDGDGQVTTE